MKMMVAFDIDADIIDVPDEIAETHVEIDENFQPQIFF